MMDNELFDYLCSIRRTVHQWPEPAFEEHKTAEVISNALEKLSLWHKSGIAKTGVIGRLDSGIKGAPVVALRADMDALPISENTGLPFSSKNHGFMHACGHDGHIAILIGAAALLKETYPEGDVVFIFQPAEEGGGGARHMIEAGVLDGVNMIFGCHIDRHLQVGQIGVKKGIETSFTDAFEIKVLGKGGHAARPHEAVDAVVIASLLVVLLQTIVSRSTDPLNPTVITIGSIHSGSAYNVIADEATLRGTIRSIDDRNRRQVFHKIKKTAASLASLNDAEIHVDINEGYPPVVNPYSGYNLARHTAEKIVGHNNVLTLTHPSMGGEDFAYYLEKVPGCFVRLGGAKKGLENVASHSSRFDFDEEAIRIGATFLAELTRDAIIKLKKRG
ncbi:MAG TPA: amidohydrolase [Nitrospirae bacterium]|nr:amidohydrolase [Nitrospirota bacterium]